jgi:crossover junction endodeoxyribonuclease RuvC
MRILGVDPGLRVTGYGAIDCGVGGARLVEAGVITPDASAPLEQRLGQLHLELRAVLDATRPDFMVIEELWTAYRSPTTAVLMGHARGVLCLAADTCGVPVRHLAHSLVKRAIVGSGAASKDQVNRMIVEQLHLLSRPRPNDVSDALALALALGNIERTDARFGALGLPRPRRTARRAIL